MGKRLTAQQIMDNYQPGDRVPHETPETFWANKLYGAKTNMVSKEKTLYQDLEERGQQHPIVIGSREEGGTPTILNGHHRLAALHHMNPNQFVNYHMVTP